MVSLTDVKLVGAFASVMMQAAGPGAPAALPARGAACPGGDPSVHPPVPVAAPSTSALLAGAADKSRPVLPLEGAEHTALQNQPNIRQARSTTAAAVGRVQEAGAGYLPHVTPAPQYLYGHEVTHGAAPRRRPRRPPPALGRPAPFRALRAARTTRQVQPLRTQLIYDFGQTTEKWKSADRSVESLQATETTTKNQIIYNVRSAFFTARADRAHRRAARHAGQPREAPDADQGVRPRGYAAGDRAGADADRRGERQGPAHPGREQLRHGPRAAESWRWGSRRSSTTTSPTRGSAAWTGRTIPPSSSIARALASRPELASLTSSSTRRTSSRSARSKEATRPPSPGSPAPDSSARLRRIPTTPSA